MTEKNNQAREPFRIDEAFERLGDFLADRHPHDPDAGLARLHAALETDPPAKFSGGNRPDRDYMLQQLSRALDVAQHGPDQDVDHIQALRNAIAIFQDDEREIWRENELPGPRAKVEVEVEDTNPHEYHILPPELTGMESVREFYLRFETRTHHIRELLPQDWAALYLLSVMTRFDEGTDAVLYTKMLDLLAGPDLYRQQEELTMYFQALMATKGDFISEEAVDR